ncbi:hypothetical protein BKA67DRAFT_531833 [Truncatella angustata]|uniref:Uncharacterized protein n=1 Tax=Truncatella angustata TaxID=152316 RepID=A0A9P9A005_9PEZI|nr:uncharacterized protein BKA67DRAFT_531833 [Truncatella angustata]KAH6656569.1 hypothetical protein BKA67DRAFT_531833 [Truncatella angustata]
MVARPEQSNTTSARSKYTALIKLFRMRTLHATRDGEIKARACGGYQVKRGADVPRGGANTVDALGLSVMQGQGLKWMEMGTLYEKSLLGRAFRGLANSHQYLPPGKQLNGLLELVISNGTESDERIKDCNYEQGLGDMWNLRWRQFVFPGDECYKNQLVEELLKSVASIANSHPTPGPSQLGDIN